MSCTPLTDAEKAKIQYVINYFSQNYEKPIDQRAADVLASMHAHFGFASAIQFTESLRDAPATTLLRAMLNVSCSDNNTGGTNPVGPLNSAAFATGRNNIYGVQDGYLQVVDLDTLKLKQSIKFANPGIAGDTHIAYDDATDSLWATYFRNTSDENAFPDANKYLAKINPDTFAVTLYDWRAAPLDGATTTNHWYEGPVNIVCSGGIAYVLRVLGTNGYYNDVCRIDLSGPSVTHEVQSNGNVSWGNIHFDGTNVLVGGNGGERADVLAGADLTLLGNTGQIFGKYPYGVTRNPSGFAYFSCGTQYIIKAEVLGAHAASTIDTGRANANPHNIRYNSADGLIYVPCFSDNTVVVLNPANDGFVVKTGYDNPFDVVFAGTRKFAVQKGYTGIKEII